MDEYELNEIINTGIIENNNYCGKKIKKIIIYDMEYDYEFEKNYTLTIIKIKCKMFSKKHWCYCHFKIRTDEDFECIEIWDLNEDTKWKKNEINIIYEL